MAVPSLVRSSGCGMDGRGITGDLRFPFAFSILRGRSWRRSGSSHANALSASSTRCKVGLGLDQAPTLKGTHLKLHKRSWQVLLLALLDLRIASAKFVEQFLEIVSQLLNGNFGREAIYDQLLHLR